MIARTIIVTLFGILVAGSPVFADTYSDTVNGMSPIAYWRLGESSGTTASDETSLVDGTYTNGVTLGQTGALGSDTAVEFDGSNDYVEILHNDAFLLDDGVVSLWFKTSDITNTQGLWSKDSNGYDTGGHLHIYVQSSRVHVRFQSSSASYTLQSNTISTDTWTHIAFSFGSDGMKLYRNGVQEDSDTYTGGLGTTSGGIGNYEPLVLGSNTWVSGDAVVTPLQDYYDGLLDEVAVFDAQLTDLQIQQLADAVPLFTDVSVATGFDIQTTRSASYGSGFHWADLDNDGDLDCIATGDTAQLFVSSSEGATFFASAFNGSMRRQGALVDLDNDGDIDFWTINDNSYDIEALMENGGLASFTDEGDMGFDDPSNSEGAAAADVDRDGWCDIVIFSEHGNWIGTSDGGDPIALSGSDASALGLNDAGDVGNGDYCSSGDVNNDGYLDFFYHYGTGKLFLSDGDGTYTEAGSGISVITGNSDKMGSAFGDYDNDGDLDLFVPRYDSGSRGYLWRNDSGTFVDVTVAAGVSDTSSQRSSCWGDYDNDGDLDLYIATYAGDSVLYSNDGDGTFTLASEDAEANGKSHDAVFVDYDNDGDLDLAVTREDDDNILLQNALDDDQYLKVRIIGAGAGGTNVAGIGTRVDLYDSSGSTLLARRDVGVARGYGGSEPLWLHFGGTDPATTYVVRVHFISGTIDTSVVPNIVSTTIGAVTIDQMLTVTEDGPLRLIRWQENDPIP